jgi:tetratricopeptide (TPR) repeat protein
MDVPGFQVPETRAMPARLWPGGRAGRGSGSTLAATATLLAALLATATAESEPMGFAPRARPVTSSRSLAEDELRRARNLEARGDVALALRAYTEALRIDSGLGEGYLGLARLRRGLGDLREAEMLYTRAVSVAEVRGRALFGRALIRRNDGRRHEAMLDLEQSVALEPDPTALATLAGWYVEGDNWPAALAAWRRLGQLRLEAGDSAGLREARISIAALSVLAAEADAVTAVPEEAGWARRALARIARRGGDR